MSLTFHPIAALTDNYIWAITKDDSQYVVIVDPGDHHPVEAYLKKHNKTVCAVIVTHHHTDHTGGIKALTQNTNIPIWGSATSTFAHITHRVKEPDTIYIDALSLQFSVLDVPGHTMDHIALYGHNALFCGDTLFAGGMGKIFEGTAEDMFCSIKKMQSLPSDTRVFCAHEYTLANLTFAARIEPDNNEIKQRLDKSKRLREKGQPTIPSLLAEEHNTNPFLRTKNPAVQQAISKQFSIDITCATELEIFTLLRYYKDKL